MLIVATKLGKNIGLAYYLKVDTHMQLQMQIMPARG